MDYIGLAKIVAWPVVVLVLGILYLFSRKNVGVKLPNGTEIKMTGEKAGSSLAELFEEFLNVYNSLLTERHKELFREILAAEGEPTVGHMIPGFSRDSEENMTALRALRGMGLIRPAQGKRWDAHSKIEVTKFGRALTTYIRGNL